MNREQPPVAYASRDPLGHGLVIRSWAPKRSVAAFWQARDWPHHMVAFHACDREHAQSCAPPEQRN